MTFFTLLQNRGHVEPPTTEPPTGTGSGGGWGTKRFYDIPRPKIRTVKSVEIPPILLRMLGKNFQVSSSANVAARIVVSRMLARGMGISTKVQYSEARAEEEQEIAEILVSWLNSRK